MVHVRTSFPIAVHISRHLPLLLTRVGSTATEGRDGDHPHKSFEQADTKIGIGIKGHMWR